MNIETLRSFLLWSAVINYGFLLWSFLVFLFAHDRLYQIHGRWFRLRVDQFDAIHYLGIAVYKLGIILLNLVPYLALLIVA